MGGICSNVEKIQYYQGDTLDVEFHVKYENEQPVDLTLFKVRFAVFNTSILKDSLNPAEITINNATGGIVTVHLLPVDSAGLVKKQRYVFDAEIYNSITGEVYTFSEGAFMVI